MSFLFSFTVIGDVTEGKSDYECSVKLFDCPN